MFSIKISAAWKSVVDSCCFDAIFTALKWIVQKLELKLAAVLIVHNICVGRAVAR